MLLNEEITLPLMLESISSDLPFGLVACVFLLATVFNAMDGGVIVFLVLGPITHNKRSTS